MPATDILPGLTVLDNRHVIAWQHDPLDERSAPCPPLPDPLAAFFAKLTW